MLSCINLFISLPFTTTSACSTILPEKNLSSAKDGRLFIAIPARNAAAPGDVKRKDEVTPP
ncbi:MAG: hypothetical protein D3912_12975 [Candidatus Electrothrix sp. AX1]|nr:hypothetical protein [Candidatus Electrothrix sp. AX1]